MSLASVSELGEWGEGLEPHLKGHNPSPFISNSLRS